MGDPISDLFLRIKNALLRKKDALDVDSSRLKESVVKVLTEEGFLSKYEVLNRGGRKMLRITLKYGLDKFGKAGNPVIRRLKQVSKPGRRVYAQVNELSNVQSGFGIAIISTPLGIISGEEAVKKNVGGEVLAYVS